MNKYRFGTREWASHNHNIVIGCEHGCKYCYARYNAVEFYKYVKSVEEFINHPKLNEKALNKKPKKYTDGRIMFPTTHDILPKHIDITIAYLEKWLKVGNDILIVSKPHFECIKYICDDLEQYKDQIVFRFTIGSINNDTLKFWEPYAPDFEERLDSLKYAYNHGFKTSVSMEPNLDTDARLLVLKLMPYITDTIWIGNMNFMDTRVDFDSWKPEDFVYKQMVEDAQTQEYIEELYEEFKDNPKIRWKESIKKMLNLPDEGCEE